MKEQQAYSDHVWEQATLDCENTLREQETLRRLNDQLQAQIAALNAFSRQNLLFSSLQGDPRVRVLEKVLDSDLRLLFRSERSNLTHLTLSGQDGDLSPQQPDLCLIFPSSLKDSASDWLYSLPPHSLHNFKDVTEAFLT